MRSGGRQRSIEDPLGALSGGLRGSADLKPRWGPADLEPQWTLGNLEPQWSIRGILSEALKRGAGNAGTLDEALEICGGAQMICSGCDVEGQEHENYGGSSLNPSRTGAGTLRHLSEGANRDEGSWVRSVDGSEGDGWPGEDASEGDGRPGEDASEGDGRPREDASEEAGAEVLRRQWRQKLELRHREDPQCRRELEL
ncbi:hypothetical protein CRENBAI_001853 [Crenichthys baileyi]|uniref:Uncharacterized protein n=1 Tax=Crenichthys baileyi TaxID=28760 RepID=A0AAV9RP60_9TELE